MHRCAIFSASTGVALWVCKVLLVICYATATTMQVNWRVEVNEPRNGKEKRSGALKPYIFTHISDIHYIYVCILMHVFIEI